MTELDDEMLRPVRVALSNDYEIALLGLAQMLARFPEQVQIVAMTTDVRMAHSPDIVLFDTFGRLPDDDAKLRAVIAENPQAKVVVYSWEDYPEAAARRHGAVGYLHKRLGAAELVAGIVALHDVDRPAPSPVVDDAGPLATWPGQVYGLSQRESEILTFITRGLTNDEVASRAFLSVNTVKTHIRSAYRKIGVQSRSQAVLWGVRHGFDSTDDTAV